MKYTHVEMFEYEIMEVQKCNISYIYLICLNLQWPTLFS